MLGSAPLATLPLGGISASSVTTTLGGVSGSATAGRFVGTVGAALVGVSSTSGAGTFNTTSVPLFGARATAGSGTFNESLLPALSGARANTAVSSFAYSFTVPLPSAGVTTQAGFIIAFGLTPNARLSLMSTRTRVRRLARISPTILH